LPCFSIKPLSYASKNSPLFELARLLVRLDHVASLIANTDHRESFSGMTPFLTIPCLLATEETSVPFCPYRDNVGIRTRAIAVIGSQPIIIVRTRAQPGNISASRIADIQILVPWYVTVKRTARGHI
jgi:hypothetical protein